MKNRIVFAAVLASASFGTLAIDETESLRQRSQLKPEFTSLSFDISGRSGNSDTEQYSLGGYHSRRWGDNFAFVMATREYAESNGVKSADSGFLHLRYNRYYSAKQSVEIFAQTNIDDFRSLESRELIGVAVRHEVSQAQAIGLGLFNEWEEYTVLDNKENYKQTRVNLYWVISKDLSKTASITNTLYYQPNIADISDWRGFNQLSIRSKLTDKLSMRFGLLLEHDSQPVLDVKPSDISYRAGFSYEF